MRVLRWSAIILAVGLIATVALTKQLTWLFFALPVLLPWFMRARAAARAARNWQRMSGGGSPGAGQTSQIETAYLRMYLDHSSGQMDGEVIKGSFRGRALSGMALDDMLILLGECGDDEQSQQVLAAYLDRQFPEWRDAAQSRAGTGGSGNGSMNREEAYEILGLEAGATAEDIKAAHHRLMAKIHPDAGGSTYLATKINQAKDFLLGE